MWGSSFADLAKKAQELQEQASSISTGELFNLDAMQSMTGNAEKKQTLQQNNDQTQTEANSPEKASFPLPTLGEPTAAVATPKPQIPPSQKGKLKIVKKKSPKLGAVKLPTNKAPIPDLSLSNKPEPAKNKDSQPAAASVPAIPVSQDQQETTQTPSKNEKEHAEADEEAAQPIDSAITKESEDTPGASEPVEKAEQPLNKGEDQAAPATESQSIPTMIEAKNEHLSENGVHSQSKHDEAIVASQKEVPTGEPKGEVESQVVKLSEKDGEAKSAQDVVEEKQTEETIESENKEEKESTKDEDKAEVSEADGALTNQNKNESSGETADKPINPPQADSGEKDAAAKSNSVSPNAGPQQETKNITTKANEPKQPQPVAPSSAQAGLDSERVMQQFTAQLQRLEANFELERKEMRLEHSRNLQQAIAQKDEEMEQAKATLKEKDTKVRELKRIKEGNELRMDSLKREVQGIKELLQQRDDDIEKTKETAKKEKIQLEQKIRAMELEQGKTKTELKSLKDELENSRGKLGETSDEYTNLKSRVKIVAGELKDRRAECRELKGKIEELQDQNANLEEHISTLGSQLSDRDRSGTEKDEEASNLRHEIEQLQRKVKEAEKKMEVQEEVHEKNLASYKKKAQSSLAVANARAAAAIQSKEEAELEARAARSTADATLERAKIAESNGQKAMVEAKEYYKEMEQAKNEALKELETSKAEMESTKKGFTELKGKWNLLVSEKEKLGADYAKQARYIETERSRGTTLQYELAETQRRSSSLQADIKELRTQLQEAESAAVANSNKPSNSSAHDTSPNPTATTSTEDSTSKATIMMLQRQLQEANQTIDELKDALENAVEMSDKPTNAAAGPVIYAPEANGGSGMGAPLFYAMEKQAELNTARNEINRLASLYADVQSEKVEAQDELKTARRELDEERAKLQRYEKLGSVSEAASDATSSSGGNVNSHQPTDSGRTNIEYLKNIMMSFLNAKTLTERKALVPVIGAVLCLTPDEQAKAIQNIEATGGIEGFGTALFETLGSRVR